MKLSNFGDLKIEIKDLTLYECDEIFPYIMNWQLQISIGEWDFLKSCTKEDVRFFQRFVCKSVNIIKEIETDGIVEVKKNQLSLLEIQDRKEHFTHLFLEILVYNFNFFSRARQLLELIVEKKA